MTAKLAILTEAGETITLPRPRRAPAVIGLLHQAVLRREEPNASGLDGLRSAQVCEAIERSARERRLVEVAIEAPVTDSHGFDDVVTIDQVIARARAMIDPGAYEWGAGRRSGCDHRTQPLALNRLALVPRVLRDVSTVDTTSSFVGVPLAIPVLLAPVAALGLYDPGDAGRGAGGDPDRDIVVLCDAHRIALGAGGGHRNRPTFLPDLSDG